MSEEVVWLTSYIQKLGPQFVVTFADCKESSLVKYHDSLGRAVRNQFDMWEDPWEPEIINGVDYSPNHPDQRSQAVIYALWKDLQ